MAQVRTSTPSKEISKKFSRTSTRSLISARVMAGAEDGVEKKRLRIDENMTGDLALLLIRWQSMDRSVSPKCDGVSESAIQPMGSAPFPTGV